MNKLIIALFAAQILGGAWLAQHTPELVDNAMQHVAARLMVAEK